MDGLHVDTKTIETVARREAREIPRARAYRNGRIAPELEGKIVILVDDGLTTGAPMHAAVTAIRRTPCCAPSS